MTSQAKSILMIDIGLTSKIIYVGAIDVTHLSVAVTLEVIPFYGWKGIPIQNIRVITCDFNEFHFSFVCVGFEGNVHDSLFLGLYTRGFAISTLASRLH